MLRVIIADDHPMVLLGVEGMLMACGSYLTIVGKARSGKELHLQLQSNPCDLLITDFTMPGL